MKTTLASKKAIALVIAGVLSVLQLVAANASITVSKESSRYFADETGTTWIPVGCNICFDRNAGGSAKTRELYDGWMTKFASCRTSPGRLSCD